MGKLEKHLDEHLLDIVSPVRPTSFHSFPNFINISRNLFFPLNNSFAIWKYIGLVATHQLNIWEIKLVDFVIRFIWKHYPTNRKSSKWIPCIFRHLFWCHGETYEGCLVIWGNENQQMFLEMSASFRPSLIGLIIVHVFFKFGLFPLLIFWSDLFRKSSYYLIRTNFGVDLIWRWTKNFKFGVDLIWRWKKKIKFGMALICQFRQIFSTPKFVWMR